MQFLDKATWSFVQGWLRETQIAVVWVLAHFSFLHY